MTARTSGAGSPLAGYPKWFTVGGVTFFMVLLFLSGIILAPTTLTQRLDWEVPWHLPGGARVVMAAIHLAASLVFMQLLGALWTVHMRVGWRKQLRRLSGGTIVAITVLLMVTTLGIYYSGDDTVSSVSALSHMGLGILLLAAYFWHLLTRANKPKGKAGPRSASKHRA